MTTTTGYWNGLPTPVRKVTGLVRQHDPSTDPPAAWWAGFTAPAFPGTTPWPTEDLQGQRVPAVEVVLDCVNHGGGPLHKPAAHSHIDAAPEHLQESA